MLRNTTCRRPSLLGRGAATTTTETSYQAAVRALAAAHDELEEAMVQLLSGPRLGRTARSEAVRAAHQVCDEADRAARAAWEETRR